MNVRKVLKKSDTIVGFRNDLWKFQRMFLPMFSSGTLKRYIESNQVRKLQIGAGPITLPGWLGTDLWPTKSIIFLDATKRFPIGDHTFDYIHSEHMIEHLSWVEGQFMLQECRRILKPGGTIRVGTPDLRVYSNLYDCMEGSFADRYIRWITDRFLQETPDYRAGFVINSIFFRWGHKFVYDGELLELALQKAGFVNIRRCAVGQSDDENLRGIERHGQIGNAEEEMNAFETMVFEGQCPAN